jgi:uncharacterized protein HemX
MPDDRDDEETKNDDSQTEAEDAQDGDTRKYTRKRRRSERLTKGAKIGAVVIALAGLGEARYQAHVADKQAEAAKEAARQATEKTAGTTGQAIETDLELTAVNQRLVKYIENHEAENEKALMRLERRVGRLEDMLFQIAIEGRNVRRAARDYTERRRRDRVTESADDLVKAFKKKPELPESPNAALKQQVAEDPSVLLKK